MENDDRVTRRSQRSFNGREALHVKVARLHVGTGQRAAAADRRQQQPPGERQPTALPTGIIGSWYAHRTSRHTEQRSAPLRYSGRWAAVPPRRRRGLGRFAGYRSGGDVGDRGEAPVLVEPGLVAERRVVLSVG